MAKLEDLLKDALVLDEDERATLAEKLLDSLDDGLSEVERLWIQEAQRRLEDYRAGLTIPVPAQQVHAKAEKLLR
jgi:putative addiction module component (TIGR02574 family)